MAFGPVRRIEAWAVVFHRDADAAVQRVGPHADRSAFAVRRDGVLHAVLHQRLQRHPRHDRRSRAVAQVDVVPQPVAEAHALDVEIGADDAQLLVEGDERRRRAVERRAEQRRELAGHPFGAGRVVVHERGNRVQGVEEEMRLHARFDRRQLRLGRQAARLRLVALFRAERDGCVVQADLQQLDERAEDAEDERDDD